jgi:hypothetical protein
MSETASHELDALVAESIAYDEELRNGSHYLYLGALRSVEAEWTLRVESGKVIARSGPSASLVRGRWPEMVAIAGPVVCPVPLVSIVSIPWVWKQ